VPAASSVIEAGAPAAAANCPRDPNPAADEGLPIVRIVFPDAAGVVVDAEEASTQAQEDRGLMYRTSMPEDHGMLFDLGASQVVEFWMHDTCIPLDMIFADPQGLVVGIVENAPPLDDTPRGVSSPSRYVLEVNGGWTTAHGVKAGQRMTIGPDAR
jgi:uncharacterized membrane protein (UPF0127 family)